MTPSRTAEHSIQGFIYQFIITLHKLLLSSDEDHIMIEGIIEDIDIKTPIGTEAIQCKYHESKAKFTLSAIYKPVLQMLCSFQKDPTAKINYKLHAHFPNEKVGSVKKLTIEEISEILNSKAKDLSKLVKELENFDKAGDFIKCFSIEFGPSFTDSEKAVIVALSKEGLSTDDVEELFYPNAIHRIAELSIISDPALRNVNKSTFINALKAKKHAAISRWTKELESYTKLLKRRREQLREHLTLNYRKRAIVIDTLFVEEFHIKGVQFIEEFINKYNSKIRLNACPTFSLLTNNHTIDEIHIRLTDKGIAVKRGIIGGKFNANDFIKAPIRNATDTEFKVRLCNHETDFNDVITNTSFDDLFVLSDQEHIMLDNIKDTNVEKISTNKMNEIKYLLSLSNTF